MPLKTITSYNLTERSASATQRKHEQIEYQADRLRSRGLAQPMRYITPFVCHLLFVFNILVGGSFLCGSPVFAQPEVGSESTYNAPKEPFVARDHGVWFGLYTTYWLSKQWGYYGEYHLRRAQFLNQMSKLYLRFGVNYKVDAQLRLTFGVVNRYTWSDYPELVTEEDYVPEFRFWEQLLFKMKYFGMRFYHQVRVEQRWRRSTSMLDPKYYYYNRFRYKLLAYIPVLGQVTKQNSFYLCAYNEIFMQAGEKVKFNYFEDNRAYVGVAYGVTDNLQLHFGYMKSFGQLDEFTFRNHDILRLSLYHKHSFF